MQTHLHTHTHTHTHTHEGQGFRDLGVDRGGGFKRHSVGTLEVHSNVSDQSDAKVLDDFCMGCSRAATVHVA